MNKDEFLARHTFSEAGRGTALRVFDTLTQDSMAQGQRTAKLLGLLIARLEHKGLLSAEDIDDMLLEVV